MRIRRSHRWDLAPRQAVRLQEELRDRVLEVPLDWSRLRTVAGCDVSIAGEELVASVVLLDARTLEVVACQDAIRETTFPYVPGLLSFREIPALLDAFRALPRRPDAVLCDGQGRAHPRRFGLACHLGYLLDLPTVGVAKSRLIGQAAEPGRRRGSRRDLRDGPERVGCLLRTRDGVRALYISVGHRIVLEDAVRLVLLCGRGYRLPEPTRLADIRARHAIGAIRRPERSGSPGA